MSFPVESGVRWIARKDARARAAARCRREGKAESRTFGGAGKLVRASSYGSAGVGIVPLFRAARAPENEEGPCGAFGGTSRGQRRGNGAGGGDVDVPRSRRTRGARRRAVRREVVGEATPRTARVQSAGAGASAPVVPVLTVVPSRERDPCITSMRTSMSFLEGRGMDLERECDDDNCKRCREKRGKRSL